MGLDMYIYKRERIVSCGEPERIEVAYWRKANQIYQWFEQNVCNGDAENCAYYVVRKEHFEELRDVCQYVLDNKDEAKNVLPTRSGFFFGSTEYDEWYYRDLEYTIEMCNKVLQEDDFDAYIYEYFTWW